MRPGNSEENPQRARRFGGSAVEQLCPGSEKEGHQLGPAGMAVQPSAYPMDLRQIGLADPLAQRALARLFALLLTDLTLPEIAGDPVQFIVQVPALENLPLVAVQPHALA